MPNFKSIVIAAFSIAAAVNIGMPTQAWSHVFSLGTQETSTLRAAQAICTPQPEIPAHLKEQCFKSCCMARFFIGSDGKSTVKLITSSGSEEVDDITLETLQHWKFRPATLDGKPVPSTRKARIEFDVE